MVVNDIQFLCVMNIKVCITIIMNHCQSFIEKQILIRYDSVSHEHASVNLNYDTKILIIMLLMDFTGKRKLPL